MPPRRKSSATPKSEAKLFRCTGYGDCDMVFTRAEHLARHARKHTGEKPFKCVVSGCSRMFSRFDNMMQHSQTHNRTGKRKSLPKAKSASTKKRRSSAGGMAEFETSDDYDEDEAMERVRSHSIHPDYHRRPPSPTSSMMMSRTLPLPRSMSLSHGYYPPALSKSPSLPDSPEEPWRPFRDVPQQRRRLSAADLKAPIHSLPENDQEPPVHPCASPVVDITSDEYEALQGFGKFSSKVEHNSSNREQVELPAIQPNLASQAAAFRQKIMPTQESFQRPLRGHAI